MSVNPGIALYPCNPQQEAANLQKIIDGLHQAGLRRFVLTEDLPLGGDADANLLKWNGTAFEVDRAIHVWCADPPPDPWEATTGEYGWCTPRGTSDTDWHIVWMASEFDTSGGGGGGGGTDKLFRFKLTADLATGGEAAAVKRIWNGADYENGAAITVVDWYGVSQGGRGMFQGVTGMEGYCGLREAGGKYDIIWMEQYAFDIEFTLLGAMGSAGANKALATVTASFHQGVAPGDQVTVHDDRQRFTDAIAGCKGSASRSEYADPNNPGTPYYKIASCQVAAMAAYCSCTADFCDDENVEAFDTWTPFGHGEFVPDAPVPAQLFNYLGLSGQEDDGLYAVRVNKTPPFTWMLANVRPHAIWAIEFEITSSGIINGFAHAEITGTYGREYPLGTPVLVHDPLGCFTCALQGAKGVAIAYGCLEDAYFVIVECQQMCFLCEGLLASDLCGDGVAEVTQLEGWPIAGYSQGPVVNTEIENPFALSAPNGSKVLLARINSAPLAPDWVVIQVQHYERDVVTADPASGRAIRISGGKLQFYKETAALQICNSGAWVDALTLTIDCPT